MPIPAVVGAGIITGVGGLLGGLIGKKGADRQAKAAEGIAANQLDWVKNLFGQRKGDIEAVQKWAGEQGLLDPKAMFDRMDSATADSRARDTKNLVAALFKQGGYRPGETAAERVLGNSEVAHAKARDQEYLSMSVDAFGRRLALAGAPYETGLIGGVLNAGTNLSNIAAQRADRAQSAASGAISGLAGAWSNYEAWRQAQKVENTNQTSNVLTGGSNGPGDTSGGTQQIGSDEWAKGLSKLGRWG